jgi:hypothetical protein
MAADIENIDIRKPAFAESCAISIKYTVSKRRAKSRMTDLRNLSYSLIALIICCEDRKSNEVVIEQHFPDPLQSLC